ncbi:hypothetical protein [Enterococcus diestrammenae]|uniref:hypothetical protein n=1 Tax=Enterococcus diestrammenae TaxID=1155073 RepID=UPI00195BF4B9
MVDLTAEKRQELWHTLTVLQKETLLAHKKYRLQSLFLTENFLEDEAWQFADFKEDPFYPKGENKLYCRCGRQVKYQFILVSTETGELMPLGSTHFAQHLGVPELVAHQVRSGLHQIDRGLDLILQQVAVGLHFPEKLYREAQVRQLLPKLPAEVAERLQAFAVADLPIYQEDQQVLFEVLKQANKGRQESHSWQPQRVGKKQTQTKDNPLEELICHLRHVELGEQIEVAAFADYLGESQRTLRRWLGLLTGGRFAVQVRQVGDDYYRIK